MSAGSTRRVEVEEVGDVSVARFVDKKILDETNIQIIGNQLVALVLRKTPSIEALQRLHDGISVGTAKQAAETKHEHLRAEIDKIKAARDGICRALSIDEVELDEMRRCFDASP